ncbi:MAG: DUF2513 domain-containing protein [Planctomycetaceae bacterium]|jgi:hypothetical protein|nr:DUF2513 domain-containing protein [Planctomycetaceae bacterium]
MKRDKELIKAILFYAEEWTGAGLPVIEPAKLSDAFHDVSMKDFRQHGQLIFDKGLAKGTLADRGIQIHSITWDGYEFIDNARVGKVWQAATKAAGELSWDVFVTVLSSTAADYAKKLLTGVLQ